MTSRAKSGAVADCVKLICIIRYLSKGIGNVGYRDGDIRAALGQRLLDMVAIVDAERNVVDVHEYGALAKMVRQPVPDTTCDRIGILSSISDSNFRHCH